MQWVSRINFLFALKNTCSCIQLLCIQLHLIILNCIELHSSTHTCIHYKCIHLHSLAHRNMFFVNSSETFETFCATHLKESFSLSGCLRRENQGLSSAVTQVHCNPLFYQLGLPAVSRRAPDS